MKKLLSVALITAMLLSFVVINVSAALSGAGTEASPYLIATKDDLAAFAASHVEGGYYKLTDDIVWSDYKQGGTAPAESNWTPVTFNGTFDGDGHTVSGLYVNSTEDYVGFFASANGTVKNLTIKDSSFTGKTKVAGIVASAKNSKDASNPGTIVIENCVNYADVTATAKDSNSGGIAGYMFSRPADETYLSVTITKCVNYGNVTCTAKGNPYLGGIVGRLIATPAVVSECANFGDITANGALAGGIAGQVSLASPTDAYTHTLSDCYNEGDVTGTYLVAGIVGRAYGNTTIKNCVSVGKVTPTVTDANAVKYGAVDGHTVSTLENNYYLDGSAAHADGTTVGNALERDGVSKKTAAELQSAAMATALGAKWAYNTTDGLTLKFLETPSTPVVPDKPVEPDTPVVPTGDITVVLAILCVVATAGVVVTSKKREDR